MDARLDPQYVAAAALAKRMQEQNPGYTITLTGHSLGGGLASYAGHWTKNGNVVTFNAARNPYASLGTNSTQLNVIVPNDMVGDPNRSDASGRIAGVGRLPGTYVTVETTTPSNLHSIEGIIGGLGQAGR